MTAHALSLVDVLGRHAAQTPDAPAVSEPGVDWSHAQLWDRARQVGAALARRGVGPGELVGTQMPPGAEHLAVLLGVMSTGAAVAPLNTSLAPDELSRYLDAIRPSLVVGAVSDGPGRIVSPDDLRDDPGAWRPVPVAPDDPAMVFGTGGTTGIPKGAVWTNGGLVAYLASSALALDCRRVDVELYFAPFFHVALATCALSTLYVGGSVRLQPRFDADLAVDLIMRGEVTRLFGPPTALDRIIRHPSFEAGRAHAVRAVLYGSTTSAPDLPARLRVAFPDATLVTGYGATEYGAVTRLRSWEDAGRMRGVGWPVPGVEISIVDSQRRPRPTGEVGELVVRAPWQMAGYLAGGVLQPAPATGIASGDLASLDRDGRVTLRGRLKELVITGGENVYPAEVERVLCEHPTVVHAAVVGVPDSEWGERVEAVVVVGPDEETAGLLDDLVAHCRARLAGYKVPKRIVVRPALPMTAAMKVDKRRVREWLDDD